MNLTQCVNAYMAVETMMDQELDYQTAYALVCLKKDLQNPVAFYQREECRLMEQYAARDDKGEIIWKGDGRFVLRDPQGGETYREQRKELGMVEATPAITPRRVRLPDRIRPAVLEALEGFLIFGGEEVQ